jgi:serine/threonine-protein kinase
MLKLLDFGITQTEFEPERKQGETLSLIGTPEYMAPEQIGHSAVDARADIYALGAVLYELITGVLPHSGQNTVDLLDNKVHDKVKPASQRVKKLRLPRYLDRVLCTALATELDQRYDNVTGLRQDLVWILGSKERAGVRRRRAVTLGMSVATGAILIAFMAVQGLPDRVRYGAAPAETEQAARPLMPAAESPALPASVAAPIAAPTAAAIPAPQPLAEPIPAAASESAAAADDAPPPSENDTAAPSRETPEDAPAAKPIDPALEKALAYAESLMGHRDLRALEEFRRLGKSHPEEPKVLEGWSRIAAATKWWGESLSVAERWAAIDASSHAHVHLARTQRRLGQVEKAIATLRALLARHPDDAEASHLLSLYGGTPVALND